MTYLGHLAFPLLVAMVVAPLSASCSKESSEKKRAAKQQQLPSEPKSPGKAVSVVVREGAWLYSAPRDDAYKAATPVAGSFRLLSEDGDWLAVETMPHVIDGSVFDLLKDGGPPPAKAREPADVHCVNTLPGLEQFRVRLHVRRVDLMAVVSRHHKKEFDDGTSFEVWPGLALEEQGEAESDALGETWYQTDEFFIQLPKDVISWHYDPSLGKKGRGYEPQSYVRAESHAELGGRATSLRMGFLAANVPAAKYRLRGDDALVTLPSRCRDVVVSVSEDALTESSSYGHVSPMWPRNLEGGWIRKGVEVFFQDGSQAGSVASTTQAGVLQFSEGGRGCYTRALRSSRSQPSDHEGEIRLCFHENDVRASPR